jgi:hypothetical protein
MIRPTAIFLVLTVAALAVFNVYHFIRADAPIHAFVWSVLAPVGMLWVWRRDSKRSVETHTLTWAILLQLALASPAESLANLRGERAGAHCLDRDHVDH